MPIPRPQIDAPSPHMIAPALRAVGLPTPLKVSYLAPAWVHQNYRLKFAPGHQLPDLMLRRLVSHPGYDTLQREVAALNIARSIGDLPVVGRFAILPERSLPWPAAVSDLMPGVHGGRILHKRPGARKKLANELGRVMAVLADTTQANFGTRADEGRFVPQRETWRQEWTGHVHELFGAARAAGTWLGPLADRVATRLLDVLPALDTVTSFALVHDDLHPSNLLFATPEGGDPNDPKLSGLIDWESAFVGDPLAEWAQLVERPPTLVGRILIGYGEDRARAVLDDPDAIARLEVYVLTRAFRRMAFCGTRLLTGERGFRRAYAIEYARVIATRWAEPGSVRALLERALDADRDAPVPTGVPSSRPNRTRWQFLDAGRFHPRLRRSHAASWAGGLAAALLSDDAPDDLGWTAVAHDAIKATPRQEVPIHAEPITDRDRWATDLQNRIVRRQQTDDTTALSCWWLTVDALSRLSDTTDPAGWTVSDAQLRGLETWMMALLEVREGALESIPRLIHGLLGAAAAKRLPELGRDPLPAAVGQRVADQLSLTWQDLAIFGGPVPGPVDAAAIRDAYREVEAERNSAHALLPVIFLAIDVLGEDLPAAPGALFGALGTTIDQVASNPSTR